MRRSWEWVLIVVTLVAFCWSLPGQEVQRVAQEMPGFAPGHHYVDFGKGESVDGFSGGLTVAHPFSVTLPQDAGGSLGFTRYYNSKSAEDAYTNELHTQALFSPDHGYLGPGWTLSFGRVFLRVGVITTTVYAPTGQLVEVRKNEWHVFFRDQSGAERRLYPAAGMIPWGYDNNPATRPAAGLYYTNDGSFMRAAFDPAADEWTLLFPDGSVRKAGGAAPGASIAPVVGPSWPNGDDPTGPRYYGCLANPNLQGWYVTQVTDRVGNATGIAYYPLDEAHPYPGSISSVTDPFGRRVIFVTRSDGMLNGLLWKVQWEGGAGMVSETLDYSTVSLDNPADPDHDFTIPLLESVTDPAGMQVKYTYQLVTWTEGDPKGFCLSRVFYPTGAVSEYQLEEYTYPYSKFPLSREGAEIEAQSRGIAVVGHSVYGRDGLSGAPTKLTWTWHRGYYPVGPTAYYLRLDFGMGFKVEPIVLEDPLGVQKVEYYSVSESNYSAVSPGKLVLSVQRRPGTDLSTFDPYRPLIYAATYSRQSWATGGGDSDLCRVYCQQCPDLLRGVMAGNPRVCGSSSGEVTAPYAVGPMGRLEVDRVWGKASVSKGYDGFGHYWVTQSGSVPSAGPPKVSLAVYDLKTAPAGPYQLDRVLWTYSGQGTVSNAEIGCAPSEGAAGNATVSEPPDWGPDDPSAPPVLVVEGQFAVVEARHDPQTGLPTYQRSALTPSPGFCFNYRTRQFLREHPAPASGDKVLSLSYDGHGNISRLLYSGGDSPATYGFNFEWDHGMVSRMWRDASPYGDEFVRVIEATTGRILSHTDPNGLTTGFQYDSLGRLTRISPPAGEYATAVAYPADSTSALGQTWATGHDILLYRGPEGYTPTVADSLSGIDAGAAYQHYLFDDLGRLVRTRALHAEGYLTETVTGYGVLGDAFLTSLPYRMDAAPPPRDFSWAAKLVHPGDAFPMAFPSADGAHPFGSATSPFLGATWEDLLAGDPELQLRTAWSFKPDGSRAQTTYAGLDRAVTLFGIQSTNGPVDSTTWYRSDVWGRLLRVEPPLGVVAHYTYDGLDHLVEVDLEGQRRTFTYDALGRVLTASNPESGVVENLGYDCIGNLLGTRDANGRAQGYTLVHSYDAVGRRSATERVASDGSRRALISTAYDRLEGVAQGLSLGKAVASTARGTLSDGTAVTATERLLYDASTGRLTQVTQGTDAGGAWAEYAFSLGYDLYGQAVTQALPRWSGTLTNRYAHGVLKQRELDGQNLSSGLQELLSFNTAGALESVDFGRGLSQETEYDAIGRPVGFSLSGPSGALLWGNGTFAGEAYRYDGAGNIASIGLAGGLRDAFEYDALSRLTRAVVHRRGAAHDYRYTYDPWGNLRQRQEAIPSGAAAGDLKTYLTAGLGLDITEAEVYAKAVAFDAPVVLEASGAPTNRLASVTRGGGSGLAPTAPQAQVYDANGNLLDDGQFLYTYDALDRQVAVSERATGALREEFVYLASGERVATRRFEGTGALAGFTQYLREGSAVLWEFDAATGREKSYLYAGTRMAASREAWRECLIPRALAEATTVATLGSPVMEEIGGAVTVTFSLSAVPSEAKSIEVRMVREASGAVEVARVDRPAGGWCQGLPVAFSGLEDGAEYQVGLTLLLEVEGAPALKPALWLVERLRLKASRGRMAAWTARRLKLEGGTVDEEVAAGWADLAPEGAQDYTALVHQGGATAVLSETTEHGDLKVPLASTSPVTFAGEDGGVVSLATPSSALPVRPPRPPIQCATRYARTYYGVDHLGTVRCTRAVDESGTVLSETTHDYEPFGVELPGADLCGNTHRFTGHERDLATGNDYMHFRFYAADMGRFQKPDNVYDGAAQNPQGWNLYSYVKGNPVNFNDPSGHWLEEYHQAMTIVAFLLFDQSQQAAIEAAEANVSIDHNKETSPYWNGVDVRRQYHGFPQPFQTWGDAIASAEVGHPMRSGMSAVEIGMALHSIQDPYVHGQYETGLHGAYGDSVRKNFGRAGEAFDATKRALSRAGLSENAIKSEAANELMTLIKGGAVELVVEEDSQGEKKILLKKTVKDEDFQRASELLNQLTTGCTSTAQTPREANTSS